MAKLTGMLFETLTHSGLASIVANTSSGSDTGSISLVGAGDGDLDGSRGARFVATGNQSASPGLAQILCGNVSGGEIQILTPGAQNVRIQTSGTNRIRFENDSSKWTYFGQPTVIGANTSDGSDNMALVLQGGGGTTPTGTRGGFIQVCGNEFLGGEAGWVKLVAGNVGGAALSLETFGPRVVRFVTDSVFRGQVAAHGTWQLNSDQGTANGALIAISENESFAGDVHRVTCWRSATTAYNFIRAQSDSNGTPDNEFIFRGDGNGLCDGSFTGGGADYAEYFETSHSGSIAVGRSVVQSGGLVRESQMGEESSVIGVVRPKGSSSSVIGNLPLNWPSKYEKDVYGAYVLDQDGNRVLNPSYNPELTYSTREERDEWVVVGLLGQVAIDKTAPKNPNWLYLKDLSQDVELWLIK